jgi:hypothetical protein
MDIKIISQNIKNNPNDYSEKDIEQLFEEYADLISRKKVTEVNQLNTEQYRNYYRTLYTKDML